MTYSPDDKDQMIRSARARNKSRLRELIDYAHLSGYQTLGVANCKGVQPLADRLIGLLRAEGFTVYALNCKESGLDGAEICADLKGPCCDPVSQAVYLNGKQTDLNINVGLCLGHGLIFQKHSNAEVTTFLVKDFETGHKPVEHLLSE